jgi:hypothetical protein
MFYIHYFMVFLYDCKLIFITIHRLELDNGSFYIVIQLFSEDQMVL